MASPITTPKQLAGITPSATSTANDPTPDPEVVWRKLYTDKWNDLRTAYTTFHQLCWQNILFYAGQLWIRWDKQQRLYSPAVPDDEYTPQPEINRFAPAADAIASVFQIPVIEVAPIVEENTTAHEVAEVANVLIEHFMKVNALTGTEKGQKNRSETAGQLFCLTGNVFTIVRPVQDSVAQKPVIQNTPMMQVACPQCGVSETVPMDHPGLQPPAPPPSDMLMGQQVQPPSPPPATVCPQCGGQTTITPTVKTEQPTDPETGKPATEPVIKWKVECLVGNPLFALPSPGQKSWETVRYMFWAERTSLDQIWKDYNFEAQPDNQYLDSMESSWEIAMNYYFTGYSSQALSAKDSALVIRIFVPPDRIKEIPEGGCATFVNEKMVKLESASEMDQLTHGGYLEMPTTFFFRTPMFDVANVQRELCRYEAVIALHAMTQASDTLLIDENTKCTNLTGRGDRIGYYRSIGPGSLPPHRLQHGTLDEGIYLQRQTLKDEIESITGAVNVWRGQQAGSVTAASAISQLRGQAEQMFSKPTTNWQNLWVETVRKGVILMQTYMQPWEIAQLMGDGYDVQIVKFKQADLDTLLTFTATSHGLPKTRDEKRNDLLALFDRGALDITDPNVRTRIHELFGETGMEQMFNRDATRARAENDAMSKGGQPTFMPEIEDLQTHFFIHSEYIKRLDFDQLPEPTKQVIIEHAMETKMALVQLMAMQNGGPAAGGGGEGEDDSPGGEGERGGAPGGPAGPKSPARPKGKGPDSKRKGAAGGRQSAPGRPGPTNKIATPTGPGGPGSTQGGGGAP